MNVESEISISEQKLIYRKSVACPLSPIFSGIVLNNTHVEKIVRDQKG